jgi:hypothetical protein
MKCHSKRVRFNLMIIYDLFLDFLVFWGLDFALTAIYPFPGQCPGMICNGLSGRTTLRWSFGAHDHPRFLQPFGIPEVIMPDRFQIFAEFVNQWDTGGNVQLDDIGIGHAIEMLDQCTQAVTMCCHQHPLPG